MATDELLKEFAQSSSDLDTDFEESGNIGLDMALTNGKGIPIGSYIILCAAKGSGKTTTCMDTVRRILAGWERTNQTKNKILYIDMEKSKELAKLIGLSAYIDNGMLLYKPGQCSITTLEKISQRIIDKKKPYCDIKYIFIDSITNLISEKELKAELEKGDFGNAVAARNKWYKKYLAPLESMGVTIFGISQFRKKQRASEYEDPNKAAVADGDLHYADIILKVSKSTGGTDAETKKVDVFNAITGKMEKLSPVFKVTYSVYEDKNRYCHSTSSTSLMTYGKGCNNWYALKTLYVSNGYLKNKGSASHPRWNFTDEVLEFLGIEVPEDMNKAELTEFLNENLPALKDFLRSVDKYHALTAAQTKAASEDDEDIDDDEYSDEEDLGDE